MKNLYTMIFGDDSLGVEDEQLLTTIKSLKKISDWRLWVQEVVNPNINNGEAQMIVLSSSRLNLSANLQILKAYIQRVDTTFADAMKLMVKTKHLSLYKMLPTTMNKKAILFLMGKNAKEKMELAREINIIPFWNIALQENDVKEMVNSFPLEEAILYSENIGCNIFWNFLFQNNKNIIKLMKMRKKA